MVVRLQPIKDHSCPVVSNKSFLRARVFVVFP
jgi:hypothetical protein